jgi:hypothetical protein
MVLEVAAFYKMSLRYLRIIRNLIGFVSVESRGESLSI